MRVLLPGRAAARAVDAPVRAMTMLEKYILVVGLLMEI
jgi:hypothetical protein